MKYFLFILSLLPSLAHSASQVSVRSNDIKTLVENRNERVQGKRKEVEAASTREGTLALSFLPTAELYAAQEKFKKGSLSAKTQPTYGAELRLNLFNGGRDSLENDRRALVAERKQQEGSQVIAQEVGKAREAYWRILYLRDYIDLLKDTRKNSANSLKAAERRIRSGVATESDRVEFEMQDIDLKRELEKSELEQKNHIRALTVLLGFPPEATLGFPEELAHQHDWEEAIRHTEADHAFLVRPAELQAREAQTASSSARRSWLPKLDAFAAYHQFNQREEEYEAASQRREKLVGLRLTMDLGFLGQKEAAALSAEAEAAQSEARYAQQEIEAHIHGEIAELQLLHDQVHAAEENSKRAERYLVLTQSEYGRGVKNSPDMVGAIEKLVSIRQKRLEIVRDFQVAKSHVLAKIGK